ncbi:MAG: hypothetical protein ACTSW1_07925 [Candidatus Hodarchaeales archaeon]
MSQIKEHITENFIKEDGRIEYLFIERVESQEKNINDDQGYIYGFFNVFKGENIEEFKEMLSKELNSIVTTYNYFKTKNVDLNDYKFAIIDENKNLNQFTSFNDQFFEKLVNSFMNLLIVGDNFNIEDIKELRLFNDWFAKYCHKW